MSDERKQTDDEQPDPPDGRGERPTDPNELAKWLIEQTTAATENDDQAESSSLKKSGDSE